MYAAAHGAVGVAWSRRPAFHSLYVTVRRSWPRPFAYRLWTALPPAEARRRLTAALPPGTLWSWSTTDRVHGWVTSRNFELGRRSNRAMNARGIWRPADDGGTFVDLEIGPRRGIAVLMSGVTVLLLLIALAVTIFTSVRVAFAPALLFMAALALYWRAWRDRAAAEDLLLFVKRTLDGMTISEPP